MNASNTSPGWVPAGALIVRVAAPAPLLAVDWARNVTAGGGGVGRPREVTRSAADQPYTSVPSDCRRSAPSYVYVADGPVRFVTFEAPSRVKPSLTAPVEPVRRFNPS